MTVERATRRLRRQSLVGIAIVIALGAALWFITEPLVRTPADGLTPIAKRLTYRSFEGRLSEGGPFRPFQAAARPDPSVHASILGVLARAAGEARSARTLQTIGASRLLLGDYDAAAEIFDQALMREAGSDELGEAIRKSRNSALLVDVSAAYQARGRQHGEAADYLVALDSSEGAWALAKTPEAAWNRALALDSLGSRQETIDSWNDYLKTDSSSSWAGHARRRIASLNAPTQVDEWRRATPELFRAAIEGRQQDVQRYVNVHRQEARVYAEEELFPSWGNAVLRGDARAANDNLTAAAAIGRALLVTGDRMVMDTADTLRHTDGAAGACIRYVSAMKCYRQQAMGEAGRLWQTVTPELRRYRIPLAARAEVFDATAVYYNGNTDSALRRIAAVADDASLDERYPTVRAQALWLRSLIIGTLGHEEEAIRDARSALQLFESAGENENAATMHTRLATYSAYIGDAREAWHHRAAALALLGRYGETVRYQSLLLETARTASEAGLTLAALRFHDAHVRVAKMNAEPVGLCSAYRLRSLARWKGGWGPGAITDLRDAASAAARVADPSMRARTEANVRATEATVYRGSDPRRAIASASGALEFFRAAGNEMRLIDLYVERALAWDAAGDKRAALLDLSTATAVLDIQRARLKSIADRRDFVQRRRAVFDTGVDLMVQQGDYASAFSFAEASRARVLLDLLAPGSERGAVWNAAAVAANLPADTTLLSYVALPDRLVTFSVTRAGVRGVVENVRRVRLRELTRQMAAACAREGDAACRERAVPLYRHLLAPVRGRLPTRIAVVADDVLCDIPFAALTASATAPYLIEEHEITLAPSATLFARGHRALQAEAPRTALFVGNPAFDPRRTPGLADLPEAEREVRYIGALYPDASVVTGAAATKRTFLAGIRRDALLHFAGHILIDAANSNRSALIFAPEKGDDGHLYPDEVLRHSFSEVSAVILSACGSTGRIEAAEGPLGFASVFLLAGAPAVVAAGTSVDDKAAFSLFVAFHQELRASGNVSAALRAAQLRMIRGPDPALRKPSAWSSFVVMV